MTTNRTNPDLKYWIWLSRALRPGRRIEPVLAHFPGGPEELFRGTEIVLRTSGVFRETELSRLVTKDLTETDRILADCAAGDLDVLTPDDRDYPPYLRPLPDRPLVLYAKGDVSLLRGSRTPFAMVGTRRAEDRTLCAAAALSGTLTKCGFLIVSGGALGVDTAAHLGALHADGPTVAVLGAGIGARYLACNEPLREAIGRQGVLLTEHPPGEEPTRYSFPVRNRIIAGMTAGTLACEATVKSGTLLTTKSAIEQGRDVFVLHPSRETAAFQGIRELIRDGATEVRCAADVLAPYRDGTSYLEPFYRQALHPDTVPETELYREVLQDGNAAFSLTLPASLQRPRTKRPIGDPLSGSARAVYDCLDGTPLSLSQLREKTGLAENALLGAVTELEVYHYIADCDGVRYTYT